MLTMPERVKKSDECLSEFQKNSRDIMAHICDELNTVAGRNGKFEIKCPEENEPPMLITSDLIYTDAYANKDSKKIRFIFNLAKGEVGMTAFNGPTPLIQNSILLEDKEGIYNEAAYYVSALGLGKPSASQHIPSLRQVAAATA